MPTLIYFHDPMCSWCWAFRPTWQQVRAGVPPGFAIEQVLGGLAPDTREPMPAEMRAKLKDIWRTIQRTVPGTRFNFAFWERCTPRRATYAACRAVIAARRQGAAFEDAMILGIQRAYYLEARNPSDEATLVAIAGAIGLDVTRFSTDLRDPGAEAELRRDICRAEDYGVRGFPTLIATQGSHRTEILIDYENPEAVLHQLRKLTPT